eukprot:679837-Pyramimonas_sp.AAC.1
MQLHARRAGAQLLPMLQQPARVCHGQVCAMLQSSIYTACEQGYIRALACSTVWSKTRARAAGYQVGDVM